MFYILTVNANSDFYEKWADILSNESIFKDVIRTFLWGLTKFLVWLCDACENLLYLANKTLGFIYSDSVSEFISEWRYVIIGVLVLSVLIFGITLIVQHKQDRSKLLTNIVIAICILTGITTLIPTLSTRTADWSQSLLDSYSSSSETVIQGATTDLYYMDANDFSNAAEKKKNNLSAAQIVNINPTEVISASDGVANKDVFSYRLNYDKNGNPIIDDIDDSGISWNNDCYYRYHIDFTTIFITLIATAIVMIFTAFKVVKITFDIIVHEILATLMAAGDWANGQKLKEVIKSLFALFFSVFMCSVMMKMYFMFSAWTSTNIDNNIGRAFLLVFAAFAVIDGPNIVEKLFGVDAGLSSVFRSVSTMFFASRGAASVIHGTRNIVNSGARAASHGAGSLHGFYSGYKEAKNNADENIANNANKNKNESSQETLKNSNSNKNNNNTNKGNANIKSNDINTNNDEKISDKTNRDDNNISSGVEYSKSNNNTDSDNSIANRANKKSDNAADNYLSRKYREPRSIIGAERRGYEQGNALGAKVGNAVANRQKNNHNVKENIRGEHNNGND